MSSILKKIVFTNIAVAAFWGQTYAAESCEWLEHWDTGSNAEKIAIPNDFRLEYFGENYKPNDRALRSRLKTCGA